MPDQSVYPGALDSFVDPTVVDTLDDPPHDVIHRKTHRSVEAIEGELGLNPRGTFATVRARLDDLDAVGTRRLYRTVLASAAGSVTIANADIDGTFADWPELEIRILGRNTAAQDQRVVFIRFNGDDTANYDTQQVRAEGETASGVQQGETSLAVLFRLPAGNAPGTAFGAAKATIFGHDRPEVRTAWIGHSYAQWAGSGQSVDVTGGEWRTSDAVTSITLIAQTGDLGAGTEIAIRGIA